MADEINGLRRALGAASAARIAPHVTLVPPVNVREEDVEESCTVLRRAAQQVGPIRLELGPPETFLPHAPVVYMAVGGDVQEIDLLRRLLEAPPLAPPLTRPARPFVPHVTLNQSMSSHLIPSVLETLTHYRAEVVVEKVTLLAFVDADRRWIPLDDADLRRQHVAGRGGIEVELAVATALDETGQDFLRRTWEDYEAAVYGHREGSETFAITARSDGQVVGAATGQFQAREPAYLGYLIVAPVWRSLGVGSQLLRATERLAREKGAPSLRLLTRAGGPAASFYARYGYVPVTRIPRWRYGHDFDLLSREL